MRSAIDDVVVMNYLYIIYKKNNHLLLTPSRHHYSLIMPMSSAVKIVSLPLNFSTRCVESHDGPGGKQTKRKSSSHITQTEETLTRCSSFNTLSDQETKFNESFQSLNSDSDEGDDHAAMEALDQLTGLKTVAAEAKFDARTRFDVLTHKLALLKEESRREDRRMLRKMMRQARINKAREDYLECLEAMSSTELQSNAPELLDDAFLKGKGLQWKEIEFDDL